MANLTLGLIGQPNAGKTTLFNQLTGASQRVGNWAGVTVERKEGVLRTPEHLLKVVDLPGTYSLSTSASQHAPDEQIARHFIQRQEANLLINVVDASNPVRHLWLTLQLMQMGVPVIVVLNMQDIARRQGITLNASALAQQLGCPVVDMVSVKGTGLHELKAAIDMAIGQLQATGTQPAVLPEDTPEQASARYQQVQNLLAGAGGTPGTGHDGFSERCDRLVLNRWLGIPIFLLVMYLMFVFAINIGGALQPIFDAGSTALFIHGMQWLGWMLNLPEWITLFLAQGIGGGINTVLPLVPQIGLMYLFMAFLEDSGYMARAAFVMDRLMQSLGLPGKAFVPLIVGFGCNVPSVMGTRSLENPRERLITMMMAPFIPCGARLAIFVVFSAAFFGRGGAWVIFCLYLTGMLAALLTGLMLRHTLLRGESAPFVMELPAYHQPHMKSLLLQTWGRLKGFTLRAGKVIIIASMVVGGLNSFTFSGQPASRIQDSALASVARSLTPLLAPIGIQPDNWQATVGLLSGAMAKEVVAGTLNTLYTAEALNDAPFDPASFSLSDELVQALRETAESLRDTLSLHTLVNPIEASKGDGEMAQSAMGVMHEKFGSGAAAFSYLLFVLLYVPCISVMGAITREENRRWMGFSVLWGINLAASLATLFYQATRLNTAPASAGIIITAVLGFNVLLIVLLRMRPVRPPSATPPSSGCGGCRSGGCH